MRAFILGAIFAVAIAVNLFADKIFPFDELTIPKHPEFLEGAKGFIMIMFVLPLLSQILFEFCRFLLPRRFDSALLICVIAILSLILFPVYIIRLEHVEWHKTFSAAELVGTLLFFILGYVSEQHALYE